MFVRTWSHEIIKIKRKGILGPTTPEHQIIWKISYFILLGHGRVSKIKKNRNHFWESLIKIGYVTFQHNFCYFPSLENDVAAYIRKLKFPWSISWMLCEKYGWVWPKELKADVGRQYSNKGGDCVRKSLLDS